MAEPSNLAELATPERYAGAVAGAVRAFASSGSASTAHCFAIVAAKSAWTRILQNHEIMEENF